MFTTNKNTLLTLNSAAESSQYVFEGTHNFYLEGGWVGELDASLCPLDFLLALQCLFHQVIL
jgi:hypothetical protein